MSIITGKLQPDEGKVEWSKNVRVGYLDQHTELKKGMTVRETLESAFVFLFELEEQMNQMFNSDIATPIFAVMSPFTPLASGKLYVEEIMEKIGVLIESEMNVRIEKVQSRMQKYTAKYQK